MQKSLFEEVDQIIFDKIEDKVSNDTRTDTVNLQSKSNMVEVVENEEQLAQSGINSSQNSNPLS